MALPLLPNIEEKYQTTKDWIDYFTSKIDSVEDEDTKDILREALRQYIVMTFEPRMIINQQLDPKLNI